MLNSFFKKLNEPFPSSASFKHNVVEMLIAGFFIASFLYFFKPFGIHRTSYNLLMVSAGFGIVTFVVGVAYNFVILKLLKLQTDLSTWTLWKWIVQLLGLLVCIAFGNLMFNWWLEPQMPINTATILNALLTTLAIGLFPCVVSGLLIQLRAVKRNQTAANELSSMVTEETHQVDSTSKTEIKYIEAMQNYVEINYGSANQPQNEIVRSTIQAIEQKYQNTSLVRCHRSFIVNTDCIEAVSGNAQGLKLTLKDCDKVVPVSRSYISKVRDLFEK